MTTKLHRTFSSRERFVADCVRDLSEREIEVELPGVEALDTGEMVDLDFRLDDGSPLLVGTGMVVGGNAEPGGRSRIRFLGLTDGSRATLDELVAETGAPPGGEARTPRDPDETLEDLVAGAFGERPRPSPDETSPALGEESVFVPPASIPEPPERPGPREPHAPPARREAGPEPGAHPEPRAVAPDPEGGEGEVPRDDPPPDEPRRKRSIWERLQVSPAVIVASLIAGITGAAADYWFEELAAFVAELRAADTAIEESPVIDIPPAGVKPSDFSVPTPAPATAEPLPASAPSPDAPPPEPGSPVPAGEERTSREPVEGPAEAASSAETEEAPADRVRLITWEEEPAGTVVTFWGNGRFLRDRVIRHPVQGGAPRELVKLRGIDLPYRQTVMEVGTPELLRIRTGFHPQDRVNELHVVLDLAGSGIELTRAEASENRLRLHLEAVDEGP